MPPNPAQPNPPAFTIPPSTPLPPMHPYNKLNQSTPASSTSTPETKDTNGNSSTGGSGLRPSYARPTPGPDARPNTFPYNSPGFKAATDNATPGSASSQGPSSHTHAGPHHHHLHHSHSRPTQTPPSAEPSPGNNGATASLPRARAMGPTTEPWNADRPMRVMNTRPPEYNTEAQREREGPWSRVVRPDEAQARRAREERERALNEASKATQANPYPRPSLPPSPSTAPASANGAASRTSTSPTTTNRPNLPLPGVQALGSRSLPSPFERERQSTGNDKPAGHNTGHNRSLSGSSNRDTLPSLSTIQSSPGKTNPTTQPGSRSLYGGPPPLSTGIGRNPSEPAPSPLASPNTSSKAPTPSSATMPTSQSAGSTPRTQPGYGRYHGAFMGLGPFGYQGPGTSYEAITNREREKQKEMLAARQAERERLAVKERADQKEKDKARQAAEARTAKPMTEYPRPLWRGGQPWYPPEEENTTNAARIEVLNAPAKPAPAAPVDSVIQQVAPSREPRPYTYAARNESAATQAALGKEREYQYTPRDKRPRMDAAVEDQAHRRGSVSKSRRKKEETGSSDKMRSPTTSQFQTHAPTRDFSQYTKEIRVWPEVISSPVEIWLKSLDDLNRTVATVQYRGSEWTLAQTQTTTRQHEGGIVTVQITGSFFGAGEFIVRGENGWDEGSVGPLAESEITRGQESRRIWGTDVYTDDSDLGLALVHAGWIRWSKEAVDSGVVRPGIDSKLGIKDSQAKRGVDVVEVTVRVVPKLLRYIATERNGVRTRSWGNGHDGGSIVIEGVKRVKVDNVMMKIARNRKIRMAEMTCQRSAVLNYPSILGEIEGSVNAVDEIPTSMFISARGPGLRYNPDDFKSWIQPSEEAVTANTENQPKDKLQDHDLVLQNATDVYSVKKSTPAAEPGTIVITVQQLKPFVKPAKEDAIVIDQDDESFICKERVSSKVHFVPQGLIIEDDESTGEARLIPVDFYSWTPRVKVE